VVRVQIPIVGQRLNDLQELVSPARPCYIVARCQVSRSMFFLVAWSESRLAYPDYILSKWALQAHSPVRHPE
jgi:hypothetical protein